MLFGLTRDCSQTSMLFFFRQDVSVVSFVICQIPFCKSAFLTSGLTHSSVLQDSPSKTPKLWLPRLRMAARCVPISVLLVVCPSSNFALRVPYIGGTSFVVIQLDRRPPTCTMPCREVNLRAIMIDAMTESLGNHVLTKVLLRDPLADGPHTRSPVCALRTTSMLFATSFLPPPLRLCLRLSRFLLTFSHWFQYLFS